MFSGRHHAARNDGDDLKIILPPDNLRNSLWHIYLVVIRMCVTNK